MSEQSPFENIDDVRAKLEARKQMHRDYAQLIIAGIADLHLRARHITEELGVYHRNWHLLKGSTRRVSNPIEFVSQDGVRQVVRVGSGEYRQFPQRTVPNYVSCYVDYPDLQDDPALHPTRKAYAEYLVPVQGTKLKPNDADLLLDTVYRNVEAALGIGISG